VVAWRRCLQSTGEIVDVASCGWCFRAFMGGFHGDRYHYVGHYSVEDCAIALRAMWALRVYDCVTSAGVVPVERGVI